MDKPPAPTYYLDACVFIDLIETPADQEPAKTIAAVLTDAEKGKIKVVTSILTIAEVTHARYEFDRRTLDPEVEKKIAMLWNPASSPVWLVDVHEQVSRDAMKLLRQGVERGWRKTRGADGIHLATAMRERVKKFFTTEHAMKKWGPLCGFEVCPPCHESEETQMELGDMTDGANP